MVVGLSVERNGRDTRDGQQRGGIDASGKQRLSEVTA
jgi:hypothetical protein